MTEEEKELLYIDLCARLPYNVLCEIWFTAAVNTKDHSILENLKLGGLTGFSSGLLTLKPYLRSISSMTEEEESEYNLIQGLSHWTADDGKMENYAESIDWLNSHHFDYRGLIEKGLALEAPKDMYRF